MNSRVLHPLVLLMLTATSLSSQQPTARQRALTLVDSGITAMGGAERLGSVAQVRMEVLTQWQRTVLGSHPFADRPSYERNIEVRDYGRNFWRNTRQFMGSQGGIEVVDVVRDTVAGVVLKRGEDPPAWNVLNVAYVEEVRELFGFAPERLLLNARAASDLAALPDTTIDGIAHARVTATIAGYRSTIHLRRTDWLPVMVRFRADETNDFGLAPWGDMEVEFWYSGWGTIAPGILFPRQRDVRRVGSPYKRMTVLAAVVNPPIAADSFAIPDSITARYPAEGARPMWDVALDTVNATEPRFVSFPRMTGATGAILLKDGWLLLETGQAVGAAKIVAERLKAISPGSRILGGVVTNTATSNGGVRWLADQHLPIWIGPGSAALVREIVGGATARTTVTTVTGGRWIHVGSDSLWMESINLPENPGVLVVYSPTHHWLYSALAAAPAYRPRFDAIIERFRSRGWPVERIGTATGATAPLAAGGP